MQLWMRERPQETFGRHAYDPADFGWSWVSLADEFRPYRERFSIPRER
jgi:hypothetical protein